MATTKPASRPAAAARRPTARTRAGDIRKSRPYLLTRGNLRALVRRVLSIAALVVLDFAGLLFGLYIALFLRQVYYGEPTLWRLPWTIESDWLPFLGVIMVLVFWQAGLYAARERRPGPGRVAGSLALVTLISLAFALGTGYPVRTSFLYPTAWLVTAVLVALLRASYDVVTRDVMRVAGVRRRAVLVGDAERVAELRRALGSGRSGIEYEFLGAGRPDDVPALLTGRPVDELIVADTDVGDEELLELVERAHAEGVKVRVAPATTELLIQREIEYVPGQGVPLFELRPPALAGADWAIKRAFDVVVSALFVVVGLPIWAAVAAAIKLNSRGPVFYRDRRVGLNESEFGMFKFRTMYADAAERQVALEAANEASGPLFKIKNDPRVTPIGRFLRRFSIDEMPQVLNVLRGEMSLVGPRPLPLRDYQQLEEWHKKRYLVLPGMTGLWQVSGRIDLSFDDLVRLDFYYLENWSIWLDVSILAKTLPAVLARRGAY